MLTKAIATDIPTGLPTKFKPNSEPTFPINESLEIKPRIAIPAAEWGITIGKSMIPKLNAWKENFSSKQIRKWNSCNCKKQMLHP